MKVTANGVLHCALSVWFREDNNNIPGNDLGNRFGKHRYDIKKRPGNNELAEHFHTGHALEDMNISILQSGITSDEERELLEEKWICRLQTLQPHGLNKHIKHYAKYMYTSYKNSI